MEYQEFIEVLAEKSRYTKREIRKMLRLITATIQDAMGRGRDVHIVGLGKFKNVGTGFMRGRNRYTGQPVIIPPRRRVRFSPAVALREIVLKSEIVFREETNLMKKFGLEKGSKHGEVRGPDRPEEGPKGKAGRSGG